MWSTVKVTSALVERGPEEEPGYKAEEELQGCLEQKLRFAELDQTAMQETEAAHKTGPEHTLTLFATEASWKKKKYAYACVTRLSVTAPTS